MPLRVAYRDQPTTSAQAEASAQMPLCVAYRDQPTSSAQAEGSAQTPLLVADDGVLQGTCAENVLLGRDARDDREQQLTQALVVAIEGLDDLLQ